ncbi:MAG: Oxygen-independent coproporphyrinogen-III oxidase 1 [Candidatus Dependentiae bacterium ADurb.Bin331]|nr:MAG: Oxygen-independent coproporphyrinogen-III oxidase 1 [Candidatus Dependentiae bacterium ADurb.Bin331]
MHFDTTSVPRSLYIHWPFCPYKCHFCNFVALAAHDQYMADYHNALVKEIETFFSRQNSKLTIDTVYLGGGTPSTYPLPLLLDTFGTLKNAVTFSSDYEMSIEVNPGTVSDEQLVAWREMGINRISIGVQSLNEMVLKRLNRHQSTKDVGEVLEKAHRLFSALSIDLILGLPGVSAEQWKETLAQVVQWPIAHISIYFLMVHEQTPLYFGVKSNKITLPPDDEVVDLYYWSIDYLAEHQFVQYEISNFARPGFESRHNKAYWDRVPFKGFGLGACSFDGNRRFQNEKNLMKYINNIGDGKDVIDFSEQLSREQIWLETLMLGLRQKNGMVYEELINFLHDEEKERFKAQVALLCDRSLMKCENGRLQLLPRALAVENEVVEKLSM